MKPQRYCPTPGCGEPIPTDKAFCPVCWESVPPETRVRIRRAYYHWCRRPTMETGRALQSVQNLAVTQILTLHHGR